jgi:hypothetical protein
MGWRTQRERQGIIPRLIYRLVKPKQGKLSSWPMAVRLDATAPTKATQLAELVEAEEEQEVLVRPQPQGQLLAATAATQMSKVLRKETPLGVVVQKGGIRTQMAPMPNMAEAAVVERAVQIQGPLAKEVRRFTEAVEAAEREVTVQQDRREVSGVHIRQGAVEAQALAMAEMGLHVSSAQVTEEVAEATLTVHATAGTEELHQVEEAAVVTVVAQTTAVMEPEARCVYGLGNSKYSRAIWPGCAEA